MNKKQDENSSTPPKRHSIKVISDSCGILTHTIRVWEKRYGTFSPERSESGRRVYSDEDLKKAKLLGKLIDQGLRISDITHHSVEELESLCSTLNKEGSSDKAINTYGRKKLIKLLHKYQIDAVADEFQHLRTILGVRDFIFHVVLPTIRELGEFVAEGKYTISQEHIISTIIRDQLSQIDLPLNTAVGGKEIALATPAGNFHELAILIANILCRVHKKRTRYLGPAHPGDCLAEAINALGVRVLLLGVLSSDKWSYERDIVSYLQTLDEGLNSKVEVALGGALFKVKLPSFQFIEKVHFLSSFEDLESFLH